MYIHVHKLREGYALSKCFSFSDQKDCLYSIHKPTSHCTSTGDSYIHTCAVPLPIDLEYVFVDLCTSSELTIKLLYKYKGELYTHVELYSYYMCLHAC